MSLLENISFKTNKSFCKLGDNDKTVSISINLKSNHDVDKSIVSEIEQFINTIIVKDYQDKSIVEDHILQQKQFAKQQKEQQKQNKKLLMQTEKKKVADIKKEEAHMKKFYKM